MERGMEYFSAAPSLGQDRCYVEFRRSVELAQWMAVALS